MYIKIHIKDKNKVFNKIYFTKYFSPQKHYFPTIIVKHKNYKNFLEDANITGNMCVGAITVSLGYLPINW